MDGVSAASGVLQIVSFALELPTAVQKFVEFCRAIKDAPEDTQRLMEELGTLAVGLAQIHRPGQVPQFDELVKGASQHCNNELSKLSKTLNELAPGLSSPSRRKRGLAALKTTLKRPYIEALRSSLENVKSTLLLVKISSIEFSQECHFQGQQQFQSDVMRAIEGLSREFKEDRSLDTQVLVVPAQLEGRSPQHVVIQSTAKINSVPELQIELSYGNKTLDGYVQKGLTLAPAPPAAHCSRPSRDRYFRDWNFTWSTPFGKLQEGSVKKVITRPEKPNEFEVIEYRRRWRLYPSALLKIMGMRYGAVIESTSNDWQFVISGFNAVHGDAHIFRFCREGDLDGVKALLKLGQASLRDRDPLGRTPLWVACQSLKFDVAELLLREGADIHEGDWAQRTPRPPILAIEANNDPDCEKKRSFISLFESHHPGEYDDDVIRKLLLRVVLFYRPNKPIEMTLQDRRDSLLIMVKQIFQYYLSHNEDAYREVAINMLDLDVQQETLQWVLRKANAPLDRNHSNSYRLCIHHVFHKHLYSTDPISAKLIVQKSGNLHAHWYVGVRWYAGCEVSAIYEDFTPTSLALYHPASFLAWRTVLQECAHDDLAQFVEQELHDSPLVDDGWTPKTLLTLFNLEITAELEQRLPCDRCGLFGYNPHMHLPWRRHLRAVRNGYTGPFDNSAQAPFSLVCSLKCADGFSVAGMFENNLGDTDVPFGPDVPRFEDPDLATVVNPELVGDDCPSKKMPGAFI